MTPRWAANFVGYTAVPHIATADRPQLQMIWQGSRANPGRGVLPKVQIDPHPDLSGLSFAQARLGLPSAHTLATRLWFSLASDM